MVLTISIIVSELVFVVFYLIFKGGVLNMTIFGKAVVLHKPTYILSTSMMVGLLVFMLLYIANNMNVNYISEYMDYMVIILMSYI